MSSTRSNIGTVSKQTFIWDGLCSARVQNLEGNKHVAPRPEWNWNLVIRTRIFQRGQSSVPGISKVWRTDLRDVVQNHPLGFVKKILGLLIIVIYLLLKFCMSKIWKTTHQSKENSIKIPLYLIQLQPLLTCGQVGFMSANPHSFPLPWLFWSKFQIAHHFIHKIFYCILL